MFVFIPDDRTLHAIDHIRRSRVAYDYVAFDRGCLFGPNRDVRGALKCVGRAATSERESSMRRLVHYLERRLIPTDIWFKIDEVLFVPHTAGCRRGR